MNGDESELESNRRSDSDDGAGVRKIESSIFCKEVIRRVPMSVVFGHLTDDEALLARLIFIEEMKPAEIAELLGWDKERTARACNRLRNKIRKRLQSIIKGTALEDLLAPTTKTRAA